MGRTTGQWRCRICSFDRWHIVTVKRKSGALYTTSFYACSGCSVMFLNPEQFNALGHAAPNIEMPTSFGTEEVSPSAEGAGLLVPLDGTTPFSPSMAAREARLRPCA